MRYLNTRISLRKVIYTHVLYKVQNTKLFFVSVQLVNKVPFDVGINNGVMNAISSSVTKLKRRDRVCYVTFDEIILRPALHHSRKDDFIRGFHDTGNKRYRQFADHAMVFMVRGIKKAWKQPVSYYFSDGGMFIVVVSRVNICFSCC